MALLDKQRKTVQWSGDLTEILERVTRRSAPDHRRASVDYACLTEANADEEIARQVDHFKSMGRPFEWKLYWHDQPADLADRLLAAGFEPGEEEAVMVAETESALPGKGNPALVRRVETHADLEDYRWVAECVFKKDYALTTGELAAAVRDNSLQHVAFIAYAEEADGLKPVSIGRVYTHPDAPFAGLYGGGTLAQYRGQGFYQRIVSARTEFAWARGIRYLMVDALPTSRPILERVGFFRLGTTTPYLFTPDPNVHMDRAVVQIAP